MAVCYKEIVGMTQINKKIYKQLKLKNHAKQVIRKFFEGTS
jgi:hypothetical protein